MCYVFIIAFAVLFGCHVVFNFLVRWRNDNMPGTRFGAVASDLLFCFSCHGTVLTHNWCILCTIYTCVCSPGASGRVHSCWRRLTLPGRVCHLWACFGAPGGAAGLVLPYLVDMPWSVYDVVLFPYPGSVVDLLLPCLRWDSVFPRLSCGCLIGCITDRWLVFDLCFVVLATVFAQSVCCVAKGCDVVLPRPGVYNVLFVLAMGRPPV